MVVVLNTQREICVLEENVGLFNKLSSAKVNWEKSEAVSVKKDSLSELVLRVFVLEDGWDEVSGSVFRGFFYFIMSQIVIKCRFHCALFVGAILRTGR